MKSIVFFFVAILAFEARCYTIQGRSSSENQAQKQDQPRNSQSESIEIVSTNPKNYTGAVTLKEYEAKPEAFYADDISDNGIWMQWDVEKSSHVPYKTVYGGYKDKETYFLMRADHQETNGHYAGKMLGYYSPMTKRAVITYDSKSYTKTDFEILLHDRSAWSSKYDDRELVPGTKEQYFCRFESDFTEFWTPGSTGEDMRLCTIPVGDGDLSSGGFETLKKACTGKRKFNSNNDPTPVIVSQKELQQNPQKFSSNLDDNGLWIYWNSKKTGIPPNAVYGGYGFEGPMFLIMADHMDDNGVYVDKIPGIYYPYKRKAFIEYQGKQYTKEIFDILVHSSYRWSDYDDETTKKITIGEEYGFCMIPGENNRIWQPGRIDLKTNKCITTYYGSITINKGGYKILRRAC